MSKYVFFLETIAPVNGSQPVFLDLAVYLADNTDNTVYYINNYFKEDHSRHETQNLIFGTPNEFDFEQVKDAVFFTPVNYLMHLLVRVKDYPESKICLYQYSDHSVSWLCNNIGDLSATKAIEQFFEDSSARMYMNYNCVNPADTYQRYENKAFLPLALSEKMDDFECSDVLNNDIINIGYLGNLSNESTQSLYNLFNNLAKMRNTKRINIHVIGNGGITLNSSFKNCSEGVTRVIFTSKLEKEDCRKYIHNNVDLILANGLNALEAATYGIPVIVPVSDSKSFIGNNYVYLFDINGYVYSFTNASLLTLNNTCYKIDKILNDIYSDGLKQAMAKKCYDYCSENNSLESIASKFITFSEQSQLYVKDCLCEPNISLCLEKFEEYAEANVGNGFADYLSFNAAKKENADDGNDESKKSVKKKALDGLVSVAKKIINDDHKFIKAQKHYKSAIRKIRRNYHKRGKLKVAYLVVFNSVFPAKPIFEKMLSDASFEPTIIVVPNVEGTMKYQVDTLKEAYDNLSEQYPGRVISGYDFKTDKYLDIKDNYDIIVFANPYKSLVHPFHYVEHFLDKNVLTLYVSYGFAALKYWEEVISTDFYNYMWKCTIETQSNFEHLKTVSKIKGKNGVVTGYIKMDKMAEAEVLPKTRKSILICPHHTIWGWKNLNISNFLKYSEFFVKLPEMFPDIDFIFRPHPLLFANLRKHYVWSEQQIEHYMARLLKHKNMVYDTSGDYFDKFINSDAMIHDCGSFIGEYLYTEKPCCYMMKSKEETYNGLIPFGQKCMDQYYHAFSEEDIIKFIQEVVVDGKDPKKEQRVDFVNKELKINYPHAADATIDMIKKELKIK